MRMFKDELNVIHYIGEDGDIDGDQSFLIKDDWIELTDEEVDAIRNPPETPDMAIVRLEAVVNAFIFAKVDEYNKANATAFGSIHTCGNYRFDTEYTHQPFCNRVWKWNVQVWEAVRAFFLSATTIPTDKELQDVLDGVEF